MSVIDDPVNLAPRAFLDAIGKIEPGVWGAPCSIELIDGTRHEHALAWENRRFGDAGSWINPQRVLAVRECLTRMPVRFAMAIQNAGESGMGFHVFVVEFRDGRSCVHMSGNLAIDLLDLPHGYTSADIVDVKPHEGRERSHEYGFRRVDFFASVEYARPKLSRGTTS